MPDAAIWRCLDASTGHITLAEMESIEACPVRAQRHEYGAILFLEDEETESEWDHHPNVLRLAKIARSRGCYLVNLDGAGHLHEGLPRYDW